MLSLIPSLTLQSSSVCYPMTAVCLQEFEDAVRQGHIYWHALPHNGQLEFFDRSLLEFAVQMTHELDARFGLPPKKAMSQVLLKVSHAALGVL